MAAHGDLDVSRETLRKLKIYQTLLNKWQSKTNLVASSTLGEFWTRHVADSIQCFELKSAARHWVDLGSGGGFPGLVIAALLADKELRTMVLVESNNKKCAFLRTVGREMAAPITVKATRIEKYIDQSNSPDVVTARAVTSLNGILGLTFPWLSRQTIGLFHKGRDYRSELEESRVNWCFDLIEHQSKTAADSVILEISSLRKR